MFIFNDFGFILCYLWRQLIEPNMDPTFPPRKFVNHNTAKKLKALRVCLKYKYTLQVML